MIGIFIGSFNPPTIAHLEICLKLKDKFQKIVFVPVNSREKYLVSLSNRVKMLQVYTKRHAFLAIDDLMKNYSYVNYRIIDLLKKKYGNITLIIGSDLLVKFSSFENIDYLLDKYSFIITQRNKDDKKIIKDYQKRMAKVEIVSYTKEISSTMARKLLINQKNLEGILDAEVYDYIRNNQLYV